VRIDSSAPTRIDLAGGTFDIWPLYLLHDRAQTVNAALSLRAHCSISSRRDYRIALVSEDAGITVEAADAAALPLDELPHVARLVRYFGVKGVDVRTRSDSPVGAGIAGSSAMAIALAGALAAWAGRTIPDDELLTIAMNIEAQVIGVPTGVQDYRPALFGGVAAIELGITGVRRVALPIDPAELEARLILAYTGASRNSGINNWEVMKRRLDGDGAVVDAFNAIRDAAIAVREGLEAADWPAVASAVQAEWQARRRLAPGVSTRELDSLVERALMAGATAAKVCGAGGGGCLFCLVEPSTRAAVTHALQSGGTTVLPIAISREGLQIRKT
jgi:D-glycero-alpha-D-manno-heptose-7-phosphate kinase